MYKTFEECNRDECYCVLSASTVNTLLNYALHRIPTGGFLEAVLANDLMESVGRADSYNRHVLPEICTYIYNEMPSACHGSYAAVSRWLERDKNHEA
jgi:hypothetical protein